MNAEQEIITWMSFLLFLRTANALTDAICGHVSNAHAARKIS